MFNLFSYSGQNYIYINWFYLFRSCLKCKLKDFSNFLLYLKKKKKSIFIVSASEQVLCQFENMDVELTRNRIVTTCEKWEDVMGYRRQFLTSPERLVWTNPHQESRDASFSTVSTVGSKSRALLSRPKSSAMRSAPYMSPYLLITYMHKKPFHLSSNCCLKTEISVKQMFKAILIFYSLKVLEKHLTRSSHNHVTLEKVTFWTKLVLVLHAHLAFNEFVPVVVRERPEIQMKNF